MELGMGGMGQTKCDSQAAEHRGVMGRAASRSRAACLWLGLLSAFSGCAGLGGKDWLSRAPQAPRSEGLNKPESTANSSGTSDSQPSNLEPVATSEPVAASQLVAAERAAASALTRPAPIEQGQAPGTAQASGTVQASGTAQASGTVQAPGSAQASGPLPEVVPASLLVPRGCRRMAGEAQCSPDCGYCNDECATPIDGRRIDPQEHLFDGGDLQPRAHVRQDWSAAGIDPTDTVVYYETAGGKVCLQPSNRVAIYAPRFGAVRQVSGANLAENALAPARVLAPLSADGLNDIYRADGMTLAAGPIAQKQIQQLDRFHEGLRMVRFTSVVPPVPVSDAVAALINVDVAATDLAAMRETIVDQTDVALIETIYLPESLTVMIAGQEASVMVNSKQAAEVYVYEIPDRCSIRITKSVSHTMASPGDVVRFTLRFENIGPNKVGNVVIVDSLSSRLEYIEGSQLCSLGTQFSAEPNDAGSLKLRWELNMPLELNEGGVISFDCRIR